MIDWLQISSGRGPEECRWVVFQLVQYLICQAKTGGLKTKLIESVPGKYPNTWKSAILALESEKDISEFLSQWEGPVQWIGKSMYRPNHKRKNWYVSVKILKPADPDSRQVKNIRIERMKSSGPGGQHANKTETAVRVTHIPTGLCAISQQERSQYLNKKLAMARLDEMIRRKEDQAKARFDGMRWQQHNVVERGNAGHVFTGMRFTLQLHKKDGKKV